MKIQEIISSLEFLAPLMLQEDYDNAGLLTGSRDWHCTGVLVTLDSTPEVIREAREKGCNLVVAHHPIVFRGLKKINGSNYVEQTVIEAIKHDIAIYAIHTNLDNVAEGVNGKIASILGLHNTSILAPKGGLLKKLAVFVPLADKNRLLDALFEAGAGQISKYSECSFSLEGSGSFLAGEGTNPLVGQKGIRHYESEARVEVVFPGWLQQGIISAMKAAHPYEEVAYDIYRIDNQHFEAGSGMLGNLNEPTDEQEFLRRISVIFNIPVIRHTPLRGKPVSKVAICGGAGSFLTRAAMAAGADFFLTADIKYHEFFDAENRLVLCDIGHYESEQYTSDLIVSVLSRNFPTFAVLKTGINTNPVRYFLGDSGK